MGPRIRKRLWLAGTALLCAGALSWIGPLVYHCRIDNTCMVYEDLLALRFPRARHALLQQETFDQIPYRLFGGTLEPGMYELIRRTYGAIPPEKKQPPFFPAKASCAVVGSSSNLLRSQYGPLIDRHEVVIRFNNAPTIGFEKDVGTKTTLRFANSTRLMIDEAGPEVDLITYMIYDHDTDRIRQYLDATAGKIPFRSVHLLNLQYLQHIQRYTPLRVPSSGLLAVFFAIGKCGKVDLFGFEKSVAAEWRRYYTPDIIQYGHDGQREQVVLNALDRIHMINIYPGCQANCQ